MKTSIHEKLLTALRQRRVVFRYHKQNGWLPVPAQIIKELEESKLLSVTGYSFADTNFIYLDDKEDCMSFMRCFKSVNFFHYMAEGDLVMVECANEIENLAPYKTK